MTAELIERLRALARAEHDDLSIGDEAADALTRLQQELAAQQRLVEALRKILCDARESVRLIAKGGSRRRADLDLAEATLTAIDAAKEGA